MDLKAVSKKLRHAADVLDDLLETAGTTVIANKIRKSMDRTATPTVQPKKRTYTKRKGKAHWTQTKAGKARMAELQRKSWLLRKQQVAAKRQKHG